MLFANSGIEDEIVRRADLLEVLPDVFMPVASIGHLIALEVLAGRHLRYGHHQQGATSAQPDRRTFDADGCD